MTQWAQGNGHAPLRTGYVIIDSEASDWWWNGSEWVNIGYYEVATATNTGKGVVQGNDTDLGVVVDAGGKMSVKNLQGKLDAKAEQTALAAEATARANADNALQTAIDGKQDKLSRTVKIDVDSNTFVNSLNDSGSNLTFSLGLSDIGGFYAGATKPSWSNLGNIPLADRIKDICAKLKHLGNAYLQTAQDGIIDYKWLSLASGVSVLPDFVIIYNRLSSVTILCIDIYVSTAISANGNVFSLLLNKPGTATGELCPVPFIGSNFVLCDLAGSAFPMLLEYNPSSSNTQAYVKAIRAIPASTRLKGQCVYLNQS